MRKTLRWVVQCDWQSEVQSAPPSVAPASATATEAAARVQCWTPMISHSIGMAIVVAAAEIATVTAKTIGNSKNATHDAGLALARERSHTRR